MVNLTELSLLPTFLAADLCQALGWGLESVVSTDWLVRPCPALRFKGHLHSAVGSVPLRGGHAVPAQMAPRRSQGYPTPGLDS